MKKNPKLAELRHLHIKGAINDRPPDETADACVERLSLSLYLSPSTIWKDYAK